MKKRILRSTVAGVLGALLVASASAASAQTRDPAQADLLFQRAKEATKRGDHASACRDFAESQRLDPAAGTLLNLGDCEEKTGQLASAWRDFSDALARLPATDARVPYAKERVKSLGPRVPQLTVILTKGAPAGTKVSLDGQEMPASSLGEPHSMDPGDYALLARSPSGAEQQVKVRIREGEVRSVTLDFASSSAIEPQSIPTPPPDTGPLSAASASRGAKPVAWVVGGIGVVGIAVGATTGLLALGAANTFRDGCPANACQDQASLDAGHRAKSFAAISTVAFGVGIAGIGVGTYMLLSKSAPLTAQAAAPVRFASPRLAFEPVATPGGGGLRLAGVF